jgi:spermidine/putrescine transport system ATP-binding protein
MLRLVNIGKQFASQTALEQVNLEIKSGEFFSLLGPSGCGKTTLLRIIGGFETPTSGEAFWEGKPLLPLTPQKRPFNMVFQRYALFPHLSVFNNVAFSLELKKMSKDEIRPRVEAMLKLMGLSKIAERMPETLSGGQAQRVALARALVNEPKILLLDEPLSALDQKLREHMQSELRQLQRHLGITFILVTHDQEEAMALSDRIAVMSEGCIEQVATPQELYQKPKSHFVAQFVGNLAPLQAEVVKQNSGEIEVKLPNSSVVCGISDEGFTRGQQVEIFVRPEKLRLGADQSKNSISAVIQNVAFKGLRYELLLESTPGQSLRAYVPPDQYLPEWGVGKNLSLNFDCKDCFVFPRPEL